MLKVFHFHHNMNVMIAIIIFRNICQTLKTLVIWRLLKKSDVFLNCKFYVCNDMFEKCLYKIFKSYVYKIYLTNMTLKFISLCKCDFNVCNHTFYNHQQNSNAIYYNIYNLIHQKHLWYIYGETSLTMFLTASLYKFLKI